MSRAQTLSLYKQFMKLVGDWPVDKLRPKLEYNVREVFRSRKDMTDQAKIDLLVHNGQKDLAFLQRVCALPQPTLDALFDVPYLQKTFFAAPRPPLPKAPQNL